MLKLWLSSTRQSHRTASTRSGGLKRCARIMNLPESYIKYLKSGGITAGFTDLEFGGYFDLEPLDKIEELNNEIGISSNAPGFTAFASDGGGEVFAFDAKGSVYLLPMIGMEPQYATKIAESWNEYASHIETA